MDETVHFHIYDDESLKITKTSLNTLPKQYTLLKIRKRICVDSINVLHMSI
jgi:hypothetical protein